MRREYIGFFFLVGAPQARIHGPFSILVRSLERYLCLRLRVSQLLAYNARQLLQRAEGAIND